MKSLPTLTVTFSLLLGLSPSSYAQSTLSKVDLNLQMIGESSYPTGSTVFGVLAEEQMLVVGSDAYFMVTSNQGNSIDLWRTDGSVPGTHLVTDAIIDGEFSSLAKVAGKVYFAGSDGTHGSELWATSGTPATTALLVDIDPGAASSSPRGLTTVGSKVFFSAQTQSMGRELAVLDTVTGTIVTIDILGGPLSAWPVSLTADPQGRGVYFECSDGVSGREPWFSDGTAAGTYQLADINPGLPTSWLTNKLAFGGEVLFTAEDGSQVRTLWKSDGSTGGTVPLLNASGLPHGKSPYYSAQSVHGGLFYFGAEGASGLHEFWSTDGTTAGTTLIWTSPIGVEEPKVTAVGSVGGNLLVSADLGLPGVGTELCVVGASGLTLLKDLNPGSIQTPPSTSIALSSSPECGVEFGGALLFRTNPDLAERALWTTDGTAAGTVLLMESSQGESPETGYSDPAGPATSPSWMTPLSGGSAVFCGSTIAEGFELHITDGTPLGTSLLLDIHSKQSPDVVFAMTRGVVHGADFYFWGFSQFEERASLYCLSAIHGIDKLVTTLGWDSNYPALPTSNWVGDHEELVVPVRADAGHQWEYQLFQTDGTAAGTVPSTLFPSDVSNVELLGSDGHLLYLAVTDSTHGAELWTSDGSAAGTAMLMDINPGSWGSSPHGGIVFDGSVFFIAHDGVIHDQLWRTDGTLAGTIKISGELVTDEFKMLSKQNSPMPMQVAGDSLFFVAVGSSGYALWSTDGTPNGTGQIHDDTPGAFSHTRYLMMTFAGKLWFSGINYNSPGKPFGTWVSDGTALGTGSVPVFPGFLGFSFDAAVQGDRLFFTAYDLAHGLELWYFDGTTVSIASDTIPGPEGGSPQGLVACGEGVYFFRNTSAWSENVELFYYDAKSGTTQLAPGFSPPLPLQGSPQAVLCDGDLLFFAFDSANEIALYRYTLPGAHTQNLGLGGSGAKLEISTPMLGGSVTATVANSPAGATGVLVASSPVATPDGALTLPGNALWIDATSFSVLGVGTTASWSVTHAVPLSPAYMGLKVNFQVCYLLPGVSAVSTSNGVGAVFGN